ncbi:MAG: hypothetical protein Q9227_000164 [Pyrenula ochraceoflavens]
MHQQTLPLRPSHQQQPPAPSSPSSSLLPPIDQTQDLTPYPLYTSLHSYLHSIHSPSFHKISHASSPTLSPSGSILAFTGTIQNALGEAVTRICTFQVPIDSGAKGKGEEPRIVTSGPHEDKGPKWSADGQRLAFLSDRKEKGVFSCYVLEVGGLGEAREFTCKEMEGGNVEWVGWEKGSKGQRGRVLMGVAEREAERSDADGSGKVGGGDGGKERAWMPKVEGVGRESGWRGVWVGDLETGGVERVGAKDGGGEEKKKSGNVWEATWAREGRVVGLVSDGPGEDEWYQAKVEEVGGDQERRVLYEAEKLKQIQGLTGRNGKVAFLEGVASDRGLVAGRVVIVELERTRKMKFWFDEGDISQVEWLDDNTLFAMGVSGLGTIAGKIDLCAKRVDLIWRCPVYTSGGWLPEAAPFLEGSNISFVMVGESADIYPELGLVRPNTDYEPLYSFHHPGADVLRSSLGSIEKAGWKSSHDGLRIEGFVHKPNEERFGPGPYPTILLVHGGPIWGWRNQWPSNMQSEAYIFQSRGYAVLRPNPRGSRGRGEDFAMGVVGDMGGADLHDDLSGLDMLVAKGIADEDRLGVTGGSYGGFMTSWLVTQDPRFKVGVSVAACNDWHTMHTLSNLAQWSRSFLKSDPYAFGGEDNHYYSRSPVMFVPRMKGDTAVLHVGGDLDHGVPISQAWQMYNAMKEAGKTTAIAAYPQEGHGVKAWPARLDYLVRVVDWFERYLPPSKADERR